MSIKVQIKISVPGEKFFTVTRSFDERRKDMAEARAVEYVNNSLFIVEESSVEIKNGLYEITFAVLMSDRPLPLGKWVTRQNAETKEEAVENAVESFCSSYTIEAVAP